MQRSGCRKQATLQEFTPINRHSDTPIWPLQRQQAGSVHAQARCFELKNSRFIRGPRT